MGLTLRRWLRGKNEDEEEKKKKEKMRIRRILEEEMIKLHQDDRELAVYSILMLGKLKLIEEGVQDEEEEIIQTKIISPKEVAREWEKWKPSAEDEVYSLITEKQALLPLNSEMVHEFIDEAERKGLKAEVIPSKLVFAKKARKERKKKKSKMSE